MQKFKQKALPLVSIDEDQRYIVGQEAIEMIQSLNGKISVISVAGLYRTGKSYLLNRMLLNRGSGFGVASTVIACTKGIWIWGKPLIQKIGDEVVNVLVIDSEGLGSLSEQMNHDAKILALTLLFSSHFIYNSVGSIDENALSGLGLIVNLSKHLKISASSEQITSVDEFPHLFWVVRDFSLQLIDKNGQQLSQKQYLQNSLVVQPGPADTDGRNEIRKAITKYFTDRDCVTLVRPLTNQSQLQNLDKMDLDLLKPEFVEQMLNFRKSIMTTLKAKTLCGKYLNGITFSQMIVSFVETINQGGIPTIQTTWKYICQQESLRAFEQCLEEFDCKIHQQIKRKIPIPKTTFLNETIIIRTQTQKLFLKMAGENSESSEYLRELNQRMDSKIELLKSDNKIENTRATQEFVSSEFQSIQRKIRGGEYKKIGELIKEIQLFQQFFKKKCPYQQPQSQSAIIQFLFRKLCQGSLAISKQNTQQQSEMIKQKGRQLELKHNKQLQEYKDKLNKQKSELLDKLSLADKLKEQLQVKIDSLSEQIQRYRYNLEDVVKQKETLETFHRKQSTRSANDLKTLVSKLERELEDCKIEKNERLSGQDREILLLKNKVQYFQKNNQELSGKTKQSESTFKQAKAEYEKSIRQLQSKYEAGKNGLNCKIRNLDSLLQERINQLAMSEAQKCVLESRIQDLEQRNKTLKDHSEQSIRQIKDQFLLEKQTQISKIHKEINVTSSQLAAKIRKLESQIIEKQSLNKQIRLQSQKQMALINQRMQFLEAASLEKNDTISKLNTEYSQLMLIVEAKDDEIAHLEAELRDNDEQSSKGNSVLEHELTILRDNLTSKHSETIELSHEIQQLGEQIKSLEAYNSGYKEDIIKLTSQMKSVDSLRKQTLIDQEIRLQQEIKKLTYEFEIQKQEEKQRSDEMLRNNEKTLIQLKNFYEMEKERNQKKLLEETQKVTALENETVAMLRDEYEHLHKSSEESIDKLSIELRDTLIKLKESEQRLQRTLLKSQSVFNQQLSEKSELIQDLKKKQVLSKQQTRKLQKQLDDQRALFLKKVENITFEMSRKEKQILQLTSKKDNNQQTIAKKDQIIMQLKREFEQQSQISNDRIDELKTKLQVLKDEHIELKIESEKELALSKQKNQFLTTKVSELIKQRQLLSSKNLVQRPQVDKNQLYKQQYQKSEQEIASLENKLEKARKAVRDGESSLAKQLSLIEKQKLQMQQKLIVSEDKVKELYAKLNLKTDQYEREIEEIKQRLSMGQSSLSLEYDKIKQDAFKKGNQITELQSKLQRETSLLEEKIRFIENQKEQLRKELDESRKKLQFMMNQLQKGRKPDEDDERKQLQNQKKLNSQLQIVKESLKRKAEQTEENQLKYKTEIKQMKDKNTQLQERLIKNQKQHKINQLLVEENDKLKKQRDQLFFTHKIQLSKEAEENRKKIADLQKKYKIAEKKSAEQTFTYEKERAKWMMERDTLNDKLNEMQERLKPKDASLLIEKKSSDKYKPFSTNYQMMRSLPYFDRKQ